MEAQLGRLAGIIRAKDAEIDALNGTMTKQFEERNALRSETADLRSRLQQLQAAHLSLDARLQESEAHRSELQSQAQRQYVPAYLTALMPAIGCKLQPGSVCNLCLVFCGQSEIIRCPLT